eukprot:CAMPEP_0182422346 /NCGR_PEP_ID=MMETSP1167-20130531/8007_1 /TAXON_ID=2988 /ORGANISM="Mallomonas Sp, Strain CCMP3275" /LENGTH=257 /DNA_ID=CAMNT_0024600327 /DNA_START=186 /DNA_END=956 /DNA_ORIENTATION=+
MNIGFGVPKKSPAEKNAVKVVTQWVSQHLSDNAKEDNAQIMVSQIQCNEPDCVPIETLVIITGDRGKWMSKLLMPVLEVKELDVQSLGIPTDWIAYIAGKKDHPSSDINSISSDNHSGTMDVDGHLEWLSESLSSIEDKLKNLSSTDKIEAIGRIESFCSTIRGTSSIDTSKSEITSSDERDSSSHLSNSNSSQPPVVATMVPMKPRITTSKTEITRSVVVSKDTGPPVRHAKGGVRPRGCPCCDPDNIDTSKSEIT